jgi:membrane peptidoglycan carboxypeptidase
MLYDVETDFGPDGSGSNYVPGNYGNDFKGLVSMRQALAMSLNIPAVKTLYLAGVEETVDFAGTLGIDSIAQSKSNFGLALVLGGGEITLTEGVSAYSVFANDGIRQPSTPIAKISKRSTGEEMAYQKQQPRRVVGEETAKKINSILSDNQSRAPVFGPRSSLNIEGYTVAAKTGTTQEYRDAWTIGYTPALAAGVWAGNNDNTPMRYGAAGIFVAAPIWQEFMAAALEHYSLADEPFQEYTKVASDKKMLTGKVQQETVFINNKTGKVISQAKAEKTEAKKVSTRLVGERHSILFYVDRDDPLGPSLPDFEDPMLQRWERSLNQAGRD